MEYDELITRVQQSPVDTPDTDTILGGMRRTLQHRRQRQLATGGVVCLLLAVVPFTFLSSSSTTHSSPTLTETVSASLPSSSDKLPAPLAGYRNSLRNHKILSMI